LPGVPSIPTDRKQKTPPFLTRFFALSIDDEGGLAPACLKAIDRNIGAGTDGCQLWTRQWLANWGEELNFSADQLRELPQVISAPRFATYLKAMGNDKERALLLYRWNLLISSAFIVPLQVCEVAVRNGVVEAIEAVHGANWPWSNGFIRSLPQTRRGFDPQVELQNVSQREPTSGKVVAELKFAFWEKVLTKGQDQRLWLPHMKSVFPGMDYSKPIPILRDHAHHQLILVRKLRNRIAHHEPIFTRNIADEYARLHEVISWRSPVAADWMDQTQGLTALIPAKPR